MLLRKGNMMWEVLGRIMLQWSHQPLNPLIQGDFPSAISINWLSSHFRTLGHFFPLFSLKDTVHVQTQAFSPADAKDFFHLVSVYFSLFLFPPALPHATQIYSSFLAQWWGQLNWFFLSLRLVVLNYCSMAISQSSDFGAVSLIYVILRAFPDIDVAHSVFISL